ncbi:hypothetical protein K5549_004595 [Capra hircus]|nr:hypothetical protein K5549_004595 [Capra hircus]
MIPVAEFKQFTEQQPAFKVLKPWWDVLAEYLTVAMLMIGVFGCTLQVTQDKIICLPSHEPRENLSEAPCQQLLPRGVSEPMGDLRELSGLKNNLDLQQYSFINQLCYETALHWYAKYFPYLVVIHTLIFMVCTSFWFKFPGTSSKIEHFISILGKCFDSPWTTRALSEVSGENHKGPAATTAGRATVTLTTTAGEGEKEKVLPEPEKVVTEPPAVTLLDKKEGEQAKALFEKVKKFRVHVEEGDILYTMYIRQTVLKVCKFLAILVYNLVYVGKISFLLSLLHSPARLPFSSQIFLRDRLKVIRIKCEELREVPLWVFGLRGLEELHLEGLFPPELARAATLESLRELKQLKVLSLRSNAGKVPASVTDVAGHLQRLSLHNDGARLLALNSLKKLAVLRELELVACGLERIPHAVFSLGALQELDLRDNHVRKLRGLEQLYLSHNKLETLPTQLGMCSSLRLLDVSHNGLHSLPAELGLLQNLQHLALSYNALEFLPDELFFCRKLRTLLLGYNLLSQLAPQVGALRALSRLELKGNRLEALPEELGNCGGLKKSGLLVEDTLYDGLPAEVRDRMEAE